MKLPLVSIMASLLIGMGFAARTSGQYMFFDTDGDGIQTEADALSLNETGVDIWVRTDATRAGVRTSLHDEKGQLPSINSYQFILRVSGGAVRWGKYTNLQPTMTIPFGPRHDETDYYHGYAGLEFLPPGKYKLGRLEMTVTSGQPRLEFAMRTPLWGVARTSFGSNVPGVDGDHTLKLGQRPSSGMKLGQRRGGDWEDSASIEPREQAANHEAVTPRLSVRLPSNPWRGSGRIEVQTSRPGRVRVQLFDLAGRLVRVVADEPSMNPGWHAFTIDTESAGRPTMAAGVYFYRVEASEGVKRGRIVLLSR